MATLNVVLHGLMAIADKEDRLNVYLPNVNIVHVFRAGFWLGETEIRARKEPYVLKGPIHGGNGQFDRTQNLFLGDVHIPATASRSTHAVLDLPRPRAILSLRTVDVDPKTDFAGNDADRVTTTKLATAQVLAYDCDVLDGVALDGHNWEAEPGASVNNLHVFAEEELGKQGSLKEALNGFKNTIRDITGLDIMLKTAGNALRANLNNQSLPDSVDPLETEDFATRNARLTDLGDTIRRASSVLRQQPNDAQTLSDLSKPFFGTGSGVTSKMGSCSQLVFRPQ